MGDNQRVRHKEEIIDGFLKQVHEDAVDEITYNKIRDIHMLEVLVDIRNNIHKLLFTDKYFRHDD